ncbi:MAG: hypothetical protein PHY47_13560 [Lachnospiraceae bacterium]|nr:hypothetical protein [Lachnospiraceae bacterium]
MKRSGIVRKCGGRNSDTRGVAEICGGVFDCRRKRRFVEMVFGSVRAKEFLAKYGVNAKDIKNLQYKLNV